MIRYTEIKNRKNHTLRAMLNLPNGVSHPPVVLNLHGFGGSLSGYKYAHTHLARVLEANGIAPEQFKVVQGNIIDDKAGQDEVKYEYYDIAVANILADVIIMLQKEIPVHIKKNGIFITSGIIDMKEEAVKAAFEANDAFEIIEVTRQGEWVSFTARKK